jgi:hypothetical protein
MGQPGQPDRAQPNGFDGDSETLSGLLGSPALNRLVAWASPVHINADFAGQTSDHVPLLAFIDRT